MIIRRIYNGINKSPGASKNCQYFVFGDIWCFAVQGDSDKIIDIKRTELCSTNVWPVNLRQVDQYS